jgi:hypothetical protein
VSGGIRKKTHVGVLQQSSATDARGTSTINDTTEPRTHKSQAFGLIGQQFLKGCGGRRAAQCKGALCPWVSSAREEPGIRQYMSQKLHRRGRSCFLSDRPMPTVATVPSDLLPRFLRSVVAVRLSKAWNKGDSQERHQDGERSLRLAVDADSKLGPQNSTLSSHAPRCCKPMTQYRPPEAPAGQKRRTVAYGTQENSPCRVFDATAVRARRTSDHRSRVQVVLSMAQLFLKDRID